MEPDSIQPDVIVARATPPGRGGIGVIRLSGAGSLEVLSALTGGHEPPRPRMATLRTLVHPTTGDVLDRGLVTTFVGPASFTGEDVVELSVHGSPYVTHVVLDACRAAGARLAERGEFTRRAWLSGRMDLAQVEALQTLIEAGSPAAHRVAVHHLEGGLSRRVAGLRDRLVGLEAALVHHIDFPDEDDAPIPVDDIARRALGLAGDVRAMAGSAPEGLLLREGATAVLAGPPNAGKSSLFNALVGEERAIVTPEPGTTRDALEAMVSIRGYPFRLVDTAGVRRGARGIEARGIEVARRHLDAARVVLFCLPAHSPVSGEALAFLREMARPEQAAVSPESPARSVLVLRTKVDESAGQASVPIEDGVALVEDVIPVSARTGDGLSRLREWLARCAFSGLMSEEAPEPSGVIMRERQAEGLGEAAGRLERFAQDVAAGVPVEMAAAHLGEAATALEEVVGVIDPDEVLDRLFGDFCIGK